MRHGIKMAVLVAGLVLGGCSSTTSVGSEHDFIGRVVAADVSQWETSAGGLSTGHRADAFGVGPGTIRLEDGTQLVIAPNTPGGNHCVHLAEDRWDGGDSSLCFAIGEYVGNGPEVEWFGLVGDGPDLPRGHIRVTVHDIDGDNSEVIVDEVGRLFRFGLDETIELDGCMDAPELVSDLDSLPKAAAHAGRLDVDREVVYGIECYYAG